MTEYAKSDRTVPQQNALLSPYSLVLDSVLLMYVSRMRQERKKYPLLPAECFIHLNHVVTDTVFRYLTNLHHVTVTCSVWCFRNNYVQDVTYVVTHKRTVKHLLGADAESTAAPFALAQWHLTMFINLAFLGLLQECACRHWVNYHLQPLVFLNVMLPVKTLCLRCPFSSITSSRKTITDKSWMWTISHEINEVLNRELNFYSEHYWATCNAATKIGQSQ